MKALIMSNDFIKNGNINALANTAYDRLRPHLENPDAIFQQENEDNKDRSWVYTFQFVIDGNDHTLIIRNVSAKHRSESEIIQRLTEVLCDANPDIIFIHMASYGHANHFSDYITVKAAKELTIGNDNIVFFTSGPMDTARFYNETGYTIFTQSGPMDIFKRLFDKMGIHDIEWEEQP